MIAARKRPNLIRALEPQWLGCVWLQGRPRQPPFCAQTLNLVRSHHEPAFSCRLFLHAYPTSKAFATPYRRTIPGKHCLSTFSSEVFHDLPDRLLYPTCLFTAYVCIMTLCYVKC